MSLAGPRERAGLSPTYTGGARRFHPPVRRCHSSLNERGAAEAAPLVTSYGSKSLGALSRYVQLVNFELTAWVSGEPLL
jgi:hypothetical protein